MKAQRAEPPRRKLRWLILFVSVITNLIIWSAAIASLFGCHLGLPTAFRHCLISGVDVYIGVASSGFSGAADVILALLPLVAIWDQKMRRLSRSLVVFAMTMGLVAAVAAFTQCSQILNNSSATLSRESPLKLAWYG